MQLTIRVVLIAVCLGLYCATGRAEVVRFDVRSARSGTWSDAATWENGRLPGAGDFVQIRPGHAVIYDVNSDKAIRMLHIGGMMTFVRDKDTRLDVGLLKIQPGEMPTDDGADCGAPNMVHATPPQPGALPAALEIGTSDKPIPPGVTATIRLLYFPGTNKETEPAIINCGGRWDVHGAPMSQTWLKLARPARSGEASITLSESVTGWKPGDQIIITSSEHLEHFSRSRRSSQTPEGYGTEDRTIAKIDGATIQLDRPLNNSHDASEDGRAEVANLSRNVVIESADPAGVRGHTMFHRNSSGSISYAEFRHLGKQGVLGRYPIHFHLVRDSMRGSSVIGASIWDSGNRWIAIHGTDYLLVRDCVGYQCLGHGYFLEDATEQYNILDHNLAVQALGARKLPHQALEFDDNTGAGFWWANGRNTLIRNCACENHQYGFRFQIEGSRRGKESFKSVRTPDGDSQETDIRTVPFLRFEDNESHSNGLYDFDFGDDPDGSVHGDAGHPFVVRNLKSWKTNYAMRPNVSYFLGEDLSFYDENYGVYHPTYDQQVFRNVKVRHINGEPINRGHDDDSFQNGSFTYDGLTLEDCKCGRDPLIQLSCTSDKPGQSGHFKNVKIINSQSTTHVVDLGGGPRNDKLENSVIYYFHDWPMTGQMLKVASVKFPDSMKDGKYQSIPQITGPDVRAAEMPESPFPELLHPIDDLPPATIITSVRRDGRSLRVRGVSEDNGEVASVEVNGKSATIVASHAGVSDWEATLDATGIKQIAAVATDRAGNTEKLPARFAVEPP
jgi:hypothetical protein